MNQKPQILLIGDSIRLGYCENVKRELENEAEVIFPDVNCRCTAFTIESIGGWLNLCDKDRLAAVHLNCGHWDAEVFLGDGMALTPLDVYGRNIKRIFTYIKRNCPDVKLSFATTTPMNPDRETIKAIGNISRTTDDIRKYNRVGVEAAKEMGAEIDDLFAVAENWPIEAYADFCHFTDASNAVLGKTVAEFLRNELNK